MSANLNFGGNAVYRDLGINFGLPTILLERGGFIVLLDEPIDTVTGPQQDLVIQSDAKFRTKTASLVAFPRSRNNFLPSGAHRKSKILPDVK